MAYQPRLQDINESSSSYSPSLKDLLSEKEEIDPNVLKRIPSALGNVAQDAWGIAKEIPGAIAKGIGNIPKDIDYLKKNIPDAASLIKNEPLEAGKSAAAGLGEFAGRVSNLPPSLVDYLAKIGMIKPQTASQFAHPFSNEEVTSGMNKLFGESTKPGEELIRGAFRNPEKIYAGGKLAQIINPLKYTESALTKDVLKTEKKQIKIHNEAYNGLWDKAEKSGFSKVPYDKSLLSDNYAVIDKFYPEKSTISLKALMEEPTLEHAQAAQSDLGNLRRSLEEKARTSPLLESEKALHKVLSETEKHIEGSMFKNGAGEVNEGLKKQYKKVTNSYRENVVPYKYNADIQAFKNKELLAKELIERLKKGEFAAKKGSAHPALTRVDKLKTLGKYGLGAAVAHELGLDKSILDRLLGKE